MILWWGCLNNIKIWQSKRWLNNQPQTFYYEITNKKNNYCSSKVTRGIVLLSSSLNISHNTWQFIHSLCIYWSFVEPTLLHWHCFVLSDTSINVLKQIPYALYRPNHFAFYVFFFFFPCFFLFVAYVRNAQLLY